MDITSSFGVRLGRFFFYEVHCNVAHAMRVKFEIMCISVILYEKYILYGDTTLLCVDGMESGCQEKLTSNH